MIWLALSAALAADPEPVDPAAYRPPVVYRVPVLPQVTAEGLPLPDPLDPAWRPELVTAEGLPLPDFERQRPTRSGPGSARVVGVVATIVTVAAVLVPAYTIAVDSANP